ncbi:glycosyltransferase family 39 protein [Candidatus Sumerlaeota bacterium]|nr:glycosyltransferase family 39 protein [Candidatus Sumerlaeota bacterium]
MKTILDNKIVSGALLGIILVLAMGLRVWGADVGLPYDFVPDEESKLTVIHDLEARRFQHWESQPSFMYYTIYLLLKVAVPMKETIISATGLGHRFTGPEADMAFAKWISRLYMGFLGTLTCFFIHRVGKLVVDKRVGLIAAYIYAVAPIPIALCHYIKEDTPLVLFTTMNLVFALKVIKHGRVKDYALAGLTAGLAFAAKYPGIMSLFVVAGAICIRENAALAGLRGFWSRAAFVLRLMRLPVAIFIFTFFCICFTYFDVVRLASGLYFQTNYMVEGHHDGIGISPLRTFFTFYIRRSLIPGMTLPIVLIAMPGIFLLLRHARRLAMIPVLWGVGYLFIAEVLPAKPYPFFSRYIIPVFPAFCLYAAATLVYLPGILARFVPARVGASAVAVGGALILSTPLYFSWMFLRTTAPDTRELAMAWVDKNAVPGALILSTTPRYTGYFDNAKFEVDELKRSGYDDKRAAYPDRIVYGIVSGLAIDRFLENKATKAKDYKFWNGRIMTEGKLLAEFLPEGPVYGYHNPWVRVYALPMPGENANKQDNSSDSGE